MDTVDGSEHYERHSDEPPPSLLTIVLDTNPRAWALLSDTLPISKAIANILVFINAHLAFNYANQVAVVASHSDRAQWLYPTPLSSHTPSPPDAPPHHTSTLNGDATEDVEMNGHNTSSNAAQPTNDANKYRPFRLIEQEVMRNLRSLIDSTPPGALAHTNSTMLAGALTLALSYINKQTTAQSSASTTNPSASAAKKESDDPHAPALTLQSRILVISVSSDLAFQYIPIMNCIFAAQRQRIPIDTLSLPPSPPSTFLQQASDATSGTYLTPTTGAHARGLLQYLLMAFLPDASARRHLIAPTKIDVDFRAACFCHKRVISIGWVCSICLSIFCEPLSEGVCLTCGTALKMGGYGERPVVVPRRKAGGKKKRRVGGGTPGTPGTPGGAGGVEAGG